MLVSCVFCRLVATYQLIAIASFAENGRLLRQDSSDNRPFAEIEKTGIFMSFKLEAAYFCNNRDHQEATCQ
jgi:hypothetical protein